MAKLISVGEGRNLTVEEFVAEYGEEWRDWAESAVAPITPEAEMTEGEQMLANRMQAEEGVNQAAARAGAESIFDLPSWDDDESIPLDDLVRQEYDDAGAEADYEARRAREAENRP